MNKHNVKELTRTESRHLVAEGKIRHGLWCELCGEEPWSEIHHLAYGFDNVKNVLFLDAQCHQLIEDEKRAHR